MIVMDPTFSGGFASAFGGYFAALLLTLVLIGTSGASIDDLLEYGLVLIGIAAAGTALYHRANWPLLSRRPVWTRRGVLRAAGATAAIAAVVVGARELLPSLFIDASLPYKLEGASLARALFDIAVLPAIGEELLFRGVILSGLLGVFGRRRAIIVSALLFATIHLSPLSFAHLALLGYVLARVRVGSGSLWPCMLIHAAYNTAVFAFAW